MSLANIPFEPFDSNDSSSGSARQQPPASVLSCDEVEKLIPAYAIGATDPDEVRAINTRLVDCANATAELTNYGKLAEALLYAVPPQQAPASLADRLAAATASTTPPLHPRPATPLARAVFPPSRLPTGSTKPSPFTLLTPGSNSTPKPQPIRWSFGRFIATAASLLLVGMNLGLLLQNQQLRAHMEQISSELEQQTKALILLAAEEPTEVVLPAAQENSEAQADVLWNSSLDIAVLYVRAFPELPADMAYQVWLRKGEQRISPGLFKVQRGGMGIFVFHVDHTLDFYDMMGITPEPAGGSPGPTAPAVVRGPL